VNGICISYFLGLVLRVTFHSTLAVLIALFFLANGGAASFSWIMAMFSLKSADAGEAISLAGMSQSVGYLLSAIGPTLCGVIFDAFGAWSLVFVLFFAMTAVMAAAGILASKKEKLFP
jgi:CP family cyanate transporter-like MFS transporter